MTRIGEPRARGEISTMMLYLERYAFRLVHIQRFGNSWRIRQV